MFFTLSVVMPTGIVKGVGSDPVVVAVPIHVLVRCGAD